MARDSDARSSEGSGRVLPQDLEAEKAVLSGLLLDNNAIHSVATEVAPTDFYHPAHQSLYDAIITLRDENQPVDLHTLSDYLNSRKKLDAIGGPIFLAEIADYEATAANVVNHARIVRDKAVKRKLIRAATEIVEMGFDEPDKADGMLDVAESKIFALSQEEARETFRSLHDEMQDTFDFVEALMQRGGGLTGVPTGFSDLDEMTGGLQQGELIIIAARPSMGKTALALNIARNAAVDHGKQVAIFSIEMTRRALTLRLLSAEAEVDMSRFQRGYITTSDHQHLVNAAGRLSHAPIWIDDSGSLSVLEMRAKARRMKAERGLDLVILDYLQLAEGSAASRDNRTLEISEISRGLKTLAKELDIPVIALSQLNRGPELRSVESRRPILADLRESGAIEQDADLIAFIYRDQVYNPETAQAGIAEIIIAKQRNGPTDTVEVNFDNKFARFRDLSRRSDAPPPSPSGSFGVVLPPDMSDSIDDEPPF